MTWNSRHSRAHCKDLHPQKKKYPDTTDAVLRIAGLLSYLNLALLLKT